MPVSVKIKSVLVHLFCMIMLVLMQFEVYGYDWMRCFHHPDSSAVQWTMTGETRVGEEGASLSEWSDPVYRRRPVRHDPPGLLPIFLTFLLTFSESDSSCPPTSPAPILFADSPHFIRFGVLRL